MMATTRPSSSACASCCGRRLTRWARDAIDAAELAGRKARARRQAAAERHQRAAPWVSMNLFFRHVVEPRFDLFGACDAAARAAAWARAPGVYAGALKRLGVEAAQAAFCSLNGRNFRNERIG